MKRIFTRATVAKSIRKEISETFPHLVFKVEGGKKGDSSVSVLFENQPPAVVKKVKSMVAKYISNQQVQYMFVNNDLSGELFAEILQYVFDNSGLHPNEDRAIEKAHDLAFRMFQNGTYLEIPHIQDNA